MLVHVPHLLTAEELAAISGKLAVAEWADGRASVGSLGARVKHNRQVPLESPTGRELGAMIQRKLEQTPLFVTAALPHKIYPPQFNRYEGGEAYGSHIDGAIMQVPNSHFSVRGDVSATIFLSAPEDYDGGELIVETSYGVQSVKLPAGDMVLYPATSLHKVQPVTRGARTACFFWVQSVVRDDAERTLLVDLDTAIQALRREHPDHPSVLPLVNVYHNLLRRWADV
jgi:PKHD-type hydroxylase